MSGPAERVVGVASCDTMVALGSATSSGATIFGKNSDRPPGECQPLALIERAEHGPGATVRCQYVEIPQVSRTARVLGSKPTWLWGFEHGINEHGVAIGNETIFAREAPSEQGLLGMDLVRLGLERSASAEEALAVLTGLIERHGQGGSGFREFPFPYNSSFLIADSREAWILEAPNRNWAARHCRATDAISNQITIDVDWERLSPGIRSHAEGKGLPLSDPFDFSETYRDVKNVPRALSEGRLRCARTRLAQGAGSLDVAAFREILRDHDVSGRAFQPGAPEGSETYFTICMHQGPSRTTASLVAELFAPPGDLPVVWASFGRPCCSVFFPVVVAGALPSSLVRGTDEPSDVLWWTFEKIALALESDPSLSNRVRATLDPLEQQLFESGRMAQTRLSQLDGEAAETFAYDFMVDVAFHLEAAAGALLADIV